MSSRSRSKIDPAPIVRGHLKTLADASTGKAQVRDLVEQIALPTAIGVTSWWFDPAISAPTGAAILALAGLFAAFLFQLVVQLFENANNWADSNPEPGPLTSRYAKLIGELSANAAYASFVASITAAVSLGAAVTSKGWQERLLTALTIALLAHLATTLLMVTRRVFLLTGSRLHDARTGALRENA